MSVGVQRVHTANFLHTRSGARRSRGSCPGRGIGPFGLRLSRYKVKYSTRLQIASSCTGSAESRSGYTKELDGGLSSAGLGLGRCMKQAASSGNQTTFRLPNPKAPSVSRLPSSYRRKPFGARIRNVEATKVARFEYISRTDFRRRFVCMEVSRTGS